MFNPQSGARTSADKASLKSKRPPDFCRARTRCRPWGGRLAGSDNTSLEADRRRLSSQSQDRRTHQSGRISDLRAENVLSYRTARNDLHLSRLGAGRVTKSWG